MEDVRTLIVRIWTPSAPDGDATIRGWVDLIGAGTSTRFVGTAELLEILQAAAADDPSSGLERCARGTR